jgi:hypothetical protein
MVILRFCTEECPVDCAKSSTGTTANTESASANAVTRTDRMRKIIEDAEGDRPVPDGTRELSNTETPALVYGSRDTALKLGLERVQRHASGPWRRYAVAVRHNWHRYYVNPARHLHQRVSPYSTSEVDFFAIYIRPEDTWYIIPARIIYPRVSLLFCSRRDPSAACMALTAKPGS